MTVENQTYYSDYNQCQNYMSKNLAAALQKSIKYNKTSSNMSDAYGLSIYFPQKNKKYLSTMLNTYEAIGMDEDYSDCLRAFATYQGAGQASGQYYGGSASPYGGLSGSGYGSQQVSMEELFSLFMGGGGVYDRAISPESMQQYITTNQFDANQLVWSEKPDGTHTLHLSEDMWSKVSRLDLNNRRFHPDPERTAGILLSHGNHPGRGRHLYRHGICAGVS